MNPLVLASVLLLGSAAPSEPPPAPASATPASAEDLFAALATLEGFEARFREEKTLALLRAPLVSEGRLYYLRGGHLVRQVEQPSASTVRIGPESLEMIDDRGTARIDLRARPDVRLFVESFVRVLAGDRAALERIYEIRFAPREAEGGWRLVLTPKTPALAHLVTRLELEGRGYAVERITVLEASGDRTQTIITDVDPARRFTAEERRTIFGL